MTARVVGPTTTLEELRALAAELEAAGSPRLAELARKAGAGDDVARKAVRAYRTDAELEAAEALSAAQDYTDGGGPRDAAGRRLDR